jgi:8-oxo-dGTP diphosphatase
MYIRPSFYLLLYTMDIPNCYYRISIKALILDEQKRFLLAKEDNGLWEFPWWWLDHGENPRDGLKREVYEEMWLEVTAIEEQPSYFITVLSPREGIDRRIANIFYTVKVKNLDFIASEECREIAFFTAKEAKELASFPNVQEFISFYNPDNHSWRSTHYH